MGYISDKDISMQYCYKNIFSIHPLFIDFTHARAHGVLVRFTIAIVKHNDHHNFGRKGFTELILSYHRSLLKEVRTRTQTKQEPGGRG